MNEVKTPKKPLIYYYAIMLLILLLFNFLAMPWIAQRQIQEVVDYLHDPGKYREIGASNDIEQATKLARAMITRYGMSSDFDMVALETVQNQYLGGDASLACSAETQAEIDRQVVALVKHQHQKALEILEKDRGKLDELANYLYQKETITGEEFMDILNREASKG